ncbi:MAG: PadR family transcriptional regulator [Nitrosopumilus sp.]|nr:PadR family transcriptional regulator [Nitrosopumilus sp.]
MMNAKLFRGSLDTIIIKLLSDNKEMYGYEITQKVKTLTEGEFKITEGALYPALHRLEAKGLLETQTKSIGNRFRKYYRLTDSGQTEVNAFLEEMDQFIQTMQLLMQPKLAK